MPPGLQFESDSELKDREGKEVKHGIFQSIARKGDVRKDCLTWNMTRGQEALLSFVLFSSVSTNLSYISLRILRAHWKPNTPALPPKN